MQKAKKEASKKDVPDDLYTEDDRKNEKFHQALAVVTSHLMKNNLNNQFITYQNKPEEGVQYELTVHGHVKFTGSEEELIEILKKREKEDEENS